MDIQDIIYDIETHPLVAAIVIFGVFFLGSRFLSAKKTTPAASETNNAGSDVAVPHPNVSETYYQVYNSYPLYQQNPPTGSPIPQPAPGPTTPPGGVPTKPPVPGIPHCPGGRWDPVKKQCVKLPISPLPPVSPKPGCPKYVTVGHWPAPDSSLWGIATENHISLSEIEKLNPQYSANWNLIHPGDRVRVC